MTPFTSSVRDSVKSCQTTASSTVSIETSQLSSSNALGASPAADSNSALSSGFGAVFELSSLLAANGGDGSAGFVINGIDARDLSGWSVSSAGDFNGDGLDDILIGAPLANPNGDFSGESYVVFGQADGVTASFELSSLNGSNGFVINGIDGGDGSGRSVSSAGDINGDGFDDILIGAYRANSNGDRSGESYIVFGSSAPFTAGFELSAPSAGDVNGDGFDDILIGAPDGDPNGISSGESYVVFGSSAPFDARFDLTTLNGTNGFVINGIGRYDSRVGISVSSAGDINGDGFDDILIGAPEGDPNGVNNGESYIIFGQASGFEASLLLRGMLMATGLMIFSSDRGSLIPMESIAAKAISFTGKPIQSLSSPHSSPKMAVMAAWVLSLMGLIREIIAGFLCLLLGILMETALMKSLSVRVKLILVRRA